jgi:hypothetical protein
VIPETVRLDPLREPDADFEALRLEAVGDLAETQAHADPPWTDHNAADPGITLLEACVWGLADLHYRIAERAWGAWPAEAVPWRDTEPARGEAARDAVADVLADPSDAASARQIVAGAPSRARAVLDAKAVLGLSAAGAEAVVRLVSEAHLLQAALDRFGALESEAAGASSSAETLEALADLTVFDDELPELLAYVRHVWVAGLFAERASELRAMVDAAADEAGALAKLAEDFVLPDGSKLSLTAAEQLLALALHPSPPTAPELWEDPDGATTLWPPHPIQARTCEPVTAEDYRRLALAAPGVRRAWVVPGLSLGVAWDGRDQAELPERRGALTLLIEPGGEPSPALKPVGTPLVAADKTLLKQFLRDAVGFPGATPELDDPFPDFRDDLDAPGPRRLLGDELAAALLTVLPVVVSGVLEISPTAREADVLTAAEDLLDGFLSSDRIAPFDPPSEPDRPLATPGEIEGPWPRSEAVRNFLAHPGGSAKPGWTPGAPVRPSEVVQLLVGIPGVVGLADLELAADATVPEWTTGDLAVPAYSVPSFARHCLCVRIFDPRECGA